MPQKITECEFTRNGNHAFPRIGKEVFHLHLADPAKWNKPLQKFDDILLPKDVALRKENFAFEIMHLEEKIMCRQEHTVFPVEKSHAEVELPPLIQTGFTLDEDLLVDVFMTDSDIKILGFDNTKRKIKIVSQKYTQEGTLKQNPQVCFLEPQVVFCTYPILVSVLENSLYVQNFAQPHKVLEIGLQRKEQFVQFVDFRNLQDICFVDKRTNIFDETPLAQAFTHIAFLTKEHGVCGDRDCQKGDVVLNMLEIDPYSNPMEIKHYKSPYEACMEGGTRDDKIVKSFVIKAISDRGNDAVLVSQYDDCVIFDCVTSVLQKPIRCPIGDENLQEFADIPIVHSGSMVKIQMFMDTKGCLFWMHSPKEKEVSVFRHNPKLQMGNSEYITSVYNFYAEHVYFFVFKEDQFFIMDQTHKIRMLTWNEETGKLNLQKTLIYANSVPKLIEKTIFDDFVVSHKVIQNKDKMFYLFDTRQTYGETHLQEKVLLDSDEFIRGPFKVKNSEMLLTETKKEFVLHPAGDKSSVDFLPNHCANQTAFFTSFVNDELVVACYGGAMLLFDKSGTFIQKVNFKSAFKLNADCFAVKDTRTVLVEKFNDSFDMSRYELKWVKNPQTNLEEFALDFVSFVSNQHLRERFDAHFVKLHEQGIYEDAAKSDFDLRKRRLLPYYNLRDETIYTHTWKLVPQTGILVYRDCSKRDQQSHMTPILFDFCNGENRDESIVTLFENKITM